MLKPMDIYVEYKVLVRKQIVIDDNDANLNSLCDVFKTAVKEVMDKATKSKIGNSYKYWVECNVNVDEV